MPRCCDPFPAFWSDCPLRLSSGKALRNFVTQCKQCGAELPDQAKFCLQCGTPVEPENPEPPEPAHPSGPQAPLPELDFVQPSLTGGVLLGLLSSLPLINAGNCLCCMWVLLGGGVATVMLTKQRPLSSITYGDGAF